MKPIIIKPADLARQRFTSKVRLQSNIDLLTGLRANSSAFADAINYLESGFRVSTSHGVMLDAWGEKVGLPRGDMNDEEYLTRLQEEMASAITSPQSRPSIGTYLTQKYGTAWARSDEAGGINGAIGALFNRAPLGRMIYAECNKMAPNIVLPESLVSATFAADVYSVATPPNATMTDNAPMMPGNCFRSVWGGLAYVHTQRAIRVKAGVTIRVKAGFSVLTRQTTNEVISQEPVAPKNTLATVKKAEVING